MNMSTVYEKVGSVMKAGRTIPASMWGRIGLVVGAFVLAFMGYRFVHRLRAA